MEGFLDLVDNKEFKLRLETVLQEKKPFLNYKNLIDDSYYKEKWFDFKTKELEKIVANQINQ